MSTGVGLSRSADALERARSDIEAIGSTGPEALARAALAASLICRAALERTESRGVHFRTDHAEASPSWDGRHVTYRSN
jgi:aspartate oxidase